MKRLVLLVALLVSIITAPSVMARDANRDVLHSEWNAQQIKEQQDLAKLKAIGSEAAATVSRSQGKPQKAPMHRDRGSVMR